MFGNFFRTTDLVFCAMGEVKNILFFFSAPKSRKDFFFLPKGGTHFYADFFFYKMYAVNLFFF